jgi:hypothetical protein
MFTSAFVGLTFCLTLAASCQSGGVGNVAFSAGLSGNQGQVFQTNVIVPYNKVYTNEGLGYNSSTGVFTAPKGGLYAFHLHALSIRNEGLGLRLYHNNELLISVYGESPGARAHGGNSIVLKLKKNDQVYVKSAYPSHVHLTFNQVYTTFTGYLIESVRDYFSLN